MNPRRLFRRYMKLSPTPGHIVGSSVSPSPESPVTRYPAAAPACDAARAPAAPGAAPAAETDRACELLELRRRYAGWVH